MSHRSVFARPGCSSFIFGRQHSWNIARVIGTDFGIQKDTGCDHYRVVAFGDDTYHSAVKFMIGSQMARRSTGYPVKMAALVICHVSLLAALVWMFP
jgi:hypothetical protein